MALSATPSPERQAIGPTVAPAGGAGPSGANSPAKPLQLPNGSQVQIRKTTNKQGQLGAALARHVPSSLTSSAPYQVRSS